MALDDQLTPDQLDEMIGEIDTDGSGTVDFEGEVILAFIGISRQAISFACSSRQRHRNCY